VSAARAITFTQAQVRRAVKAAESAGLKVRGIRVYPDGSIEVETGDKPAAATSQQKPSTATGWEDV
jgi:hypothetical protein